MQKRSELVLYEIRNYYEKYKLMPTVRYLQKKFNYKSTNSIYKHLLSLEKDGYLIRNSFNKLIISNYNTDYTLKNLEIINSKKHMALAIDNNKYCAFIIKNNYFIKMHICKGDTLIIKKTNKLKNNDLGLFIINNKYQILKYFYRDGFYLLSDKESIILHKVKIIGKVTMIERKIKTLAKS